MNHDSGHGVFGCIAATANAAQCPEGANLFSLVAFHFDAFKNFSNAVFGDAFLLALILTLIAGIAVFSSFIIETPQIKPLFLFGGTLSVLPQKQELIHWLSLHENSPPI